MTNPKSLTDKTGTFLGKSGFWNNHVFFAAAEIREELIAQIEKFKSFTDFLPAHVGEAFKF